MARYRIVYNRSNCIGAGACESLDSEHFKVVEDGKADLLKSIEKDGKWVLETDELKTVVEAAQSCPARVIQVFDLEKNKQIDV